MRFRYTLPAVLLTAGSAFAQGNAIGVWNSGDGFTAVGWFMGTGYPPGSAGNMFWQALPDNVTTYFRNGAGCIRELDVCGWEIEVTHFDASVAAYDGPRMQARNAVVNPASTSRWIPGATVYIDMASIPGLVTGGAGTFAFGIKLSMTFPAGGSAPVPTAPAGSGEAVMWVWQDYMMTLGDGNDLFMVSTNTEPVGGGSRGISYSGGSTSGGQNFILPSFNIGFGTQSGEFSVTWLCKQSMIQPVLNAQLITAGGQILGGGGPPAVFTIRYTDGRAAFYPIAGDVVSYNANSNDSTPVSGAFGTTWIAPFVNFSGDDTGGDPLPEAWVSTLLAYVYCSPVSKWIDDFCLLTGACAVGTGGVLSPAGANHGLWLGLDLPVFINVTVLLNGIVFADISAGPQWAGPEVRAFQSVASPVGLLGRNLVAVGADLDVTGATIPWVGEYRTLIEGPQAGYTPIGVGGPAPFFGFGQYLGGLAGMTFGVQGWVLDLNTTTIVDTTNVEYAVLQ